jgi:hypothetical protein
LFRVLALTFLSALRAVSVGRFENLSEGGRARTTHGQNNIDEGIRSTGFLKRLT